MSKPGADPSSGISSVDALIPTERHPACRQREARPGCRTERENLAGDAKGHGCVRKGDRKRPYSIEGGFHGSSDCPPVEALVGRRPTLTMLRWCTDGKSRAANAQFGGKGDTR